MNYDPSPFGLGILALWGAIYARDQLEVAVERVREWREPDPLEKLQREFETSDMDHAEFERRVDALLDPDDERIRERVEEVGGIGPAIAGEVAHCFESIEHVRRADQEELQSVPHVGEERAESIRRHFE